MYAVNDFKTNLILLSKTSKGNSNDTEIDKAYKGPKITPLISVPPEKDSVKLVKNQPENALLNVLKRVTTLEGLLDKTKKKLKNSLAEVKEKDMEIIRLKDKIRLLEEEQLDKKMSSSLKNDFYTLLEVSQVLQSRVTAIENFLKTDSCWWNNPNPLYNDEPFNSLEYDEKPDLDLFLQRIKELNFEAGETHVCQKTKQGGAFQTCQTLSLTCFGDGIEIKGHAFRPYSSLTTQLFIKDILDGFFPSELQSEFPRGVIFNVYDRRYEFYYDKENKFKGEGYKLDSKPSDTNLKDVKLKKRKLSFPQEEVRTLENDNDLSSADFPFDFIGFPQVTDLKKQVYKNKFGDSSSKIRNGYKCNGNGGGDRSFMYRQNNENLSLTDKTSKICSNKQNSNRSCCEQEIVMGSNPRIKVLNPDAKITDSCVQLKIRSLNNKDLYILTMQINQTIGQLYSYLPEEAKDCSVMYYKDSSNRIYLTDNNSTLKDYGIVKNSVLVLAKQKWNKI